MSQAKVDKYKQEKANRKQTLKKENVSGTKTHGSRMNIQIAQWD